MLTNDHSNSRSSEVSVDRHPKNNSLGHLISLTAREFDRVFVPSFIHGFVSFVSSSSLLSNSVASADSDKRVGVSAHWWSGPLRNLIVKDDRANASIFPAASSVSRKNLFLSFYYFLFRQLARRRLGQDCFTPASQRNITTISILADIAGR